MFETRIKNLQDSLLSHEIDALLITSPYNISYLTGIHAFSVEEREARILITKQNIYLFTDARYSEMIRSQVPFIKLREISYSNSLSKQFKEIFTKNSIKYLGFEEENITYKEVADLEEKFAKIEFVPTTEFIENGRVIKDNNEIEKIKNACKVNDNAFKFLLKYLIPGVSELEIKFTLENFIRSQSAQLSFESIVAFGKNSAIPHHLSSNSKLLASDIVLLDFGSKVDGYCSDMSRTVFIGKPSEELAKMYKSTLEAQEIALDYLKTHMKGDFQIGKMQTLANSHLDAMGFSEIPHSLGHGVGLQVHESPSLNPFSDENLEPGTIVTVEPGIYVQGVGGIRIEDTIHITPDGYEILTKSSKQLTVL